MKKFLTFSIISLISFLILNKNVKAEENYIIKSYYSSINSKFVDSNITITEEQVNNIFMTDKEKFIEYDNQTTYGKGYIKSLLSMFDNGSFEEYLNNYDSWIVVNDDSRNGDRLYFFNKEDIYLKAINESSSSKYFSVVIKQGYAYSFYSNSYWKINDQILFYPYLYYSNSDITITSPDTQNYKTLLLSSSDLIKLAFGNTLAPEINITKFGENTTTTINNNSIITSISYNISFTSFNLNNYKYLYSFDNKNWTSINENDYKLLVKENGTFYIKVTDMNDNYIISETFTTTSITKNIIEYKIEDGSEKGKKVYIKLYNFNDTDYFILNNFQTGSENKYYYSETNDITLDNINIDNSYTISAYDKDNKLLKREIIDIQVEEAKLNNERYILANILYDRKTIIFSYGNLKKNDKCYYKISSEEETEVNCNNSYEININKNGYIEIYVKNNDEIVIKKGFNLSFIKDLPIFKFESYYNDSESKQVLKIIIDNLKNNDKIYYSYDKENWTELENKRINYLDFYMSTDVYFKVERNSEIVSEAYFDLVYKAFENSSDNNGKKNYSGLKGLLEFFKDITKNITNEPIKGMNSVYENIRKSKIGLYILLIIITSIIILVLKSIKR